jgi:hypothetical protein
VHPKAVEAVVNRLVEAVEAHRLGEAEGRPTGVEGHIPVDKVVSSADNRKRLRTYTVCAISSILHLCLVQFHLLL